MLAVYIQHGFYPENVLKRNECNRVANLYFLRKGSFDGAGWEIDKGEGTSAIKRGSTKQEANLKGLQFSNYAHCTVISKASQVKSLSFRGTASFLFLLNIKFL